MSELKGYAEFNLITATIVGFVVGAIAGAIAGGLTDWLNGAIRGGICMAVVALLVAIANNHRSIPCPKSELETRPTETPPPTSYPSSHRWKE